MTIPISIMSGAGNLFTVIDSREISLSKEQAASLAPRLCSAQYNSFVDTEGLMLISASADDTVQMDFFNPDGSYGAMCGNGGRCAANFALLRNIITPKETFFVTALGVRYNATSHDDGTITLLFPPPRRCAAPVLISVPSSINPEPSLPCITGSYLDVGSTHLIVDFEENAPILGIKDDFHSFDLNSIAPPLRSHTELPQGGANVSFISGESGTFHMRTYERGVEAETGACGTGAIATACAIACGDYFAEPQNEFRIVPTSGSTITVTLRSDAPPITPRQIEQVYGIELRGSAEVLHCGEASIDI